MGLRVKGLAVIQRITVELMIFAKMPKMDNCPILPFLQILILSYICYGVLVKQPFSKRNSGLPGAMEPIH